MGEAVKSRCFGVIREAQLEDEEKAADQRVIERAGAARL